MKKWAIHLFHMLVFTTMMGYLFTHQNQVKMFRWHPCAIPIGELAITGPVECMVIFGIRHARTAVVQKHFFTRAMGLTHGTFLSIKLNLKTMTVLIITIWRLKK